MRSASVSQGGRAAPGDPYVNVGNRLGDLVTTSLRFENAETRLYGDAAVTNAGVPTPCTPC